MRLFLLILLSAWAWADPAGDARTAIQAAYNRSNQALEQFDLKGWQAVHSPNYVFTDASGNRYSHAEMMARFKASLEKFRRVRSKSQILDIQLQGAKAFVRVGQTSEVEYRSWWPGRPAKAASQGVDQDQWDRTNQGWLLVSSTSLREQASAGGKTSLKEAGYIRVVRSGGRPTAMETAIVRFVNNSGQTVDLVAAVHLGEKDYYRQLSREFAGYDAVLYELIAPHSVPSEDGGYERAIPMPSDAADNPLSAGQLYLTDLLGLSFQLNEVDYTPKNFVHADLSPEELINSMTKRGESAKSMVMTLIRESLKDSAMVDPADALALDYSMASIMVKGPSPRDRVILRRVLSNSFKNMDKITAGLAGPQGSTLINVRNQQALAVAGREIKRGRRRLAIFYGAAHMPDMESRLVKKMHFKKQSVRYLKAWDLRDQANFKADST